MSLRKAAWTGVLAALVGAACFRVEARAWEPNRQDREAAVRTGALGGWFRRLSAWLDGRVPAQPDRIDEAGVRALLARPAVADALARRHLMAKVGVERLEAFAREDGAARAFLGWLFARPDAIALCLLGATPVGAARRQRDDWTIEPAVLARWSRIARADPESKKGLWLRLAIAVSLSPPGTGEPGVGQAKVPADPLDRYRHFKSAWERGELVPAFATHTVWELRQVVRSNASDADLAWVRAMIETWRPDLWRREEAVRSTSEVQYTRSPIPYGNTFRNVIAGGGKCGPRAAWALFVCRAFGVPAVGVRQPGHACAAYKSAHPEGEPQPGSLWKVVYGRGWSASRVGGLAGPEFLEEMRLRAHREAFRLGERVRWLAAAVGSEARAKALRALADQVQRAALERDPPPPLQTPAAPRHRPREAPAPPPAGVIYIEAAAYTRIAGAVVMESADGGKQVWCPKNGENWGPTTRIDYAVRVPRAGRWGLTLRVATPNPGQVVEVWRGGRRLATVRVPNTAGLWATTPEVEVVLEAGPQTLMLTRPRPQRGLAIRWLRLRPKP